MSENNSNKDNTDENNPVQENKPEENVSPADSGNSDEAVHPDKESIPTGASLVEAKSVSMESGWQWIVQGFDLFKKEPGLWIGMVLILLVIMFVTSWIPFVSPIIMPIFTGGLMFACRKLDIGEKMEIGDLFQGFQTRAMPLAIIGLINLAAMLVIGIIAIAITGVGAGLGYMGGEGGALTGGVLGFLFAMLVSMLLYFPVAMALWFAPALVFFHEELKPIDAMLMSFKASLKNILPFLIYGLVVMVMIFVASIPLGLGLLVAVPVLIASIYKAYQQIFLD